MGILLTMVDFTFNPRIRAGCDLLVAGILRLYQPLIHASVQDATKRRPKRGKQSGL